MIIISTSKPKKKAIFSSCRDPCSPILPLFRSAVLTGNKLLAYELDMALMKHIFSSGNIGTVKVKEIGSEILLLIKKVLTESELHPFHTKRVK